MAILGDANWVGATAGRTRFARELVRRLSQAHATGLEVSSLVPHVASIENHIDLVVKQHITAVAGFEKPEAGRHLSFPRALHYGVWELPISERLPLQTARFFGAKRSLWNRIRRATRDAGTFHIMIDAPAVAEGGPGTEKTITWLAKRIATLRDRGMVSLETLRTMSARLADVPVVRPQRSILRRSRLIEALPYPPRPGRFSGRRLSKFSDRFIYRTSRNAFHPRYARIPPHSAIPTSDIVPPREGPPNGMLRKRSRVNISATKPPTTIPATDIALPIGPQPRIPANGTASRSFKIKLV